MKKEITFAEFQKAMEVVEAYKNQIDEKHGMAKNIFANITQPRLKEIKRNDKIRIIKSSGLSQKIIEGNVYRVMGSWISYDKYSRVKFRRYCEDNKIENIDYLTFDQYQELLIAAKCRIVQEVRIDTGKYAYTVNSEVYKFELVS